MLLFLLLAEVLELLVLLADIDGLDPWANALVAYFMALTVVGGVILQWPIGRLSDRIDRRTVLAVTAVAASLSGIALAMFGGDSVWLALACLS